MLAALQDRGACVPRQYHADYCRHVPREFNTRTDMLANKCLDNRAQSKACRRVTVLPRWVRVYFEGGLRRTRGAAAWSLMGASRLAKNGEPAWALFAERACLINPCASSVDAEVVALEQAVCALYQFLTNRYVLLSEEGAVLML